MAGGGENALEGGAGNDERRRVDQRMALQGVRLPERAVDHQLDLVIRVVDERQERDGARLDVEPRLQSLGRTQAQLARADRRRERFQVYRLVGADHDEEVTQAFLVPEKEVLGLRAGQRRHQPRRFVDGVDGRMIHPLARDTERLEEGKEVGHGAGRDHTPSWTGCRVRLDGPWAPPRRLRYADVAGGG